MKSLNQIIALFVLLISPIGAKAQMEIDAVPTKDENVSFQDSVNYMSVNDKYFSPARYRAERRAIIKERNNLEINTSLLGSLNSLNAAWLETSGGDNSISISSNAFLKHKYEKDRFSVVSSLSAKFGYYRVNVERLADDGSKYEEGVWYKNQDEFALSIAPSLKMVKNWAYTATFGFRSQFANGYVSSTSQEEINLKSGFLSPGYLNLSLGLTYQSPNDKLPFKITMSPLSLSGVFVRDAQIRTNALYQYKDHVEGNWKYSEPYGVNPYETSKFEGGSSLQVDFDRTFGRNSTFRYRTSMASFYGWITEISSKNVYNNYKDFEIAMKDWNSSTKNTPKPTYSLRPTVRWTNALAIKATDYITTDINFQLYYDRAQNQKIQTKTLLSVGVTYTFKNK